jgi:hypothetical protein
VEMRPMRRKFVFFLGWLERLEGSSSKVTSCGPGEMSLKSWVGTPMDQPKSQYPAMETVEERSSSRSVRRGKGQMDALRERVRGEERAD